MIGTTNLKKIEKRKLDEKYNIEGRPGLGLGVVLSMKVML